MQNANGNTFLLALGANAGPGPQDDAKRLEMALQRIGAKLGTVLATSRIYRTPAFPQGAGPDFSNACVLVESRLSAAEMLDGLHAIEAGMGRVRGARWAQRLIDLDILAMGDSVLPDRATVQRWMTLAGEDQRCLAPETLLLPHPRLHERAFVLVPLADVAPDWVHPLTGQSVRAMVAALDDAARAAIIAL
ncbi:MAG: 2-amino-4-hydroxy-6-hydroxymethyldihydropteridine diphosphokinase [Pararhodobacter sp.]|nr:2-amino-4-hydroxy-6-hydroxymethyldihydropteridine diphosphokinase [Pararhodobacter sp.]